MIYLVFVAYTSLKMSSFSLINCCVKIDAPFLESGLFITQLKRQVLLRQFSRGIFFESPYANLSKCTQLPNWSEFNSDNRHMHCIRNRGTKSHFGAFVSVPGTALSRRNRLAVEFFISATSTEHDIISF